MAWKRRYVGCRVTTELRARRLFDGARIHQTLIYRSRLERAFVDRMRDGDLHSGFELMAELLDIAQPDDIGASSIPLFGHRLPRWRGERVDRLVIVSNGGYGDILQWSRYFRAAADRARNLTIATRAHLVRLFAENGFHAEPIQRVWGALANADAYVPDLLLCLALRAGYEPVRGHLRSNDPLHMPRDRLNVGLVWAGDPGNSTDYIRSAKVGDIEPLRLVAGVRYVNLMIGSRAREAPAWMESAPINIQDFSDTARIVAGLDLVLAVDTSVVHLAGALGVPCWIALADRACWRWERHDTQSNWYRKARLFRQRRQGDWVGVFARMADELRHFAVPRLGSHGR